MSNNFKPTNWYEVEDGLIAELMKSDGGRAFYEYFKPEIEYIEARAVYLTKDLNMFLRQFGCKSAKRSKLEWLNQRLCHSFEQRFDRMRGSLTDQKGSGTMTDLQSLSCGGAK